jgi:hypothetical protein
MNALKGQASAAVVQDQEGVRFQTLIVIVIYKQEYASLLIKVNQMMNTEKLTKITYILTIITIFSLLAYKNLEFLIDNGFIKTAYSQQDSVDDDWEPSPSYATESDQPPSDAPESDQPPSDSPNKSFECAGLSSDTNSYEPGQTVTFTCTHSKENIGFDHYNYRLATPEDQSFPAPGEDNYWGNINGSIEYVIPNIEGEYIVQCQACATEGSSTCTNWGLAQGWTE